MKHYLMIALMAFAAVTVTLILAGIFYFKFTDHGQLTLQYFRDARQANQFLRGFTPDSIKSTCIQIKQGYFFQKCFRPKATAFIQERSPGLAGLHEILKLGLTLTEFDRKSLLLSNEAHSEVKAELTKMAWVLFALGHLGNFHPTNSRELGLMRTIVAMASITWNESVSIAGGHLSRRPASAEDAAIGKALDSYNRAALPLLNRLKWISESGTAGGK